TIVDTTGVFIVRNTNFHASRATSTSPITCRKEDSVNTAIAGATAFGSQSGGRGAYALRVGTSISVSPALSWLILLNRIYLYGDGIAIGIGNTQDRNFDHVVVGRPYHRNAWLRLTAIRWSIQGGNYDLQR